jgi:hypothetical protein
MQFDMRLGAPRDEAGERVERKGKICSDYRDHLVLEGLKNSRCKDH